MFWLSIASFSPSPSAPMRWLTGSSMPLMAICARVVPRVPIFSSRRVTSKPGVSRSARKAVVPGGAGIGVGGGDDDIDLGLAAVGHEAFGAVEAIAPVRQDGPGLQMGHIRAAPGLGEASRPRASASPSRLRGNASATSPGRAAITLTAAQLATHITATAGEALAISSVATQHATRVRVGTADPCRGGTWSRRRCGAGCRGWPGWAGPSDPAPGPPARSPRAWPWRRCRRESGGTRREDIARPCTLRLARRPSAPGMGHDARTRLRPTSRRRPCPDIWNAVSEQYGLPSPAVNDVAAGHPSMGPRAQTRARGS